MYKGKLSKNDYLRPLLISIIKSFQKLIIIIIIIIIIIRRRRRRRIFIEETFSLTLLRHTLSILKRLYSPPEDW